MSLHRPKWLSLKVIKFMTESFCQGYGSALSFSGSGSSCSSSFGPESESSFFVMRIRIQLKKFGVEKDQKKRLLKNKKPCSWTKFNNKNYNYFSSNFSLLDPDPGEEMNADLCGSGSTALVVELCTTGVIWQLNLWKHRYSTGTGTYRYCLLVRKYEILLLTTSVLGMST